jgi:hypothetical protein
MKTTNHLPVLVAALILPCSVALGQITNQTADFSASLPWGHGSCQIRWDRTPASIKARGEDGMSESSGDYFAVIDAGLWTPLGEMPYLRSIVSQTIWNLGSITAEDVGKTVKFSALFGWQGGEASRVKDLVVAKQTGLYVGDTPSRDSPKTAGLDGGAEFAFDSVGKKDWGEVTSTYTIKPEDVGKQLNVAVVVRSKQEIAEGLPVIATSDWKVTVAE